MLFTAALQLVDPWHVTDVEFRDADAGGREPRITIGYGPGSRFHCPEAGCGEAACPVHDTMERTWRHLNFFQYKAFIHASVPRAVLLQFFLSNFCTVFPQYGPLVSSRNCTV